MEDKTVNRKKTYGMVLLTVIVLLTSMLLSSCALFPDDEEELVPPLVTTRKTEYLTIEVTRTTLELVVRGVASVVAPQSSDVYFENSSGVLSKVWVKGDYVNGRRVCEPTIPAWPSNLRSRRCAPVSRSLNLPRPKKSGTPDS